MEPLILMKVHTLPARFPFSLNKVGCQFLLFTVFFQDGSSKQTEVNCSKSSRWLNGRGGWEHNVTRVWILAQVFAFADFFCHCYTVFWYQNSILKKWNSAIYFLCGNCALMLGPICAFCLWIALRRWSTKFLNCCSQVCKDRHYFKVNIMLNKMWQM